MENENKINIENNVENETTPQYDSTVLDFKGELLSIDTEVITYVLSEITNRFKLEDFSKFETEKQVLHYFYYKEESSLGGIDINFKDNEMQKLFFKSLATDFIEYKYSTNVYLTDVRNKINEKIDNIIAKINNLTDLDTFNLNEEYMNNFKTDKIPKFLEKNIFDAIEALNLRFKRKRDSIIDKEDYLQRQKDENLRNYYSGFLSKKLIAFEGGDKEVIFKILLYSNLKDIYKSQRVKQIFMNSIYDICNCLNYFEGIQEFDKEINSKKGFKYIEEQLRNTFKRYEYNDYHLYIIASYFFLAFYVMSDINIKEKNKEANKKTNNLNNPIMVLILKNILKNFAKYCQTKSYNLNTYKYLFNYFQKYMLEADKSEKINKQYEAKDIEMKIKESNNFGFSEEFYSLKNEISNIEINGPFSKNLNNFVRLIPITKKRVSYTITILISGYLSQKDDIDTWAPFFNFDKENSEYYVFKWPSSDVLTFVGKLLGHFGKTVFNSFKLCYKKAECAGRILALLLLTNKEFYDCQINLVGFSLGCHVVMNCIKELNKFKYHGFMINNILLMGGATVIEEPDNWRDIFRDNVAGRIINCYSTYDDVLSYLFTIRMRRTPIGIKSLDIKDEKGEYPIVEDYDFSDIRLGHLEYRKKFEIILQRINFFDWN